MAAGQLHLFLRQLRCLMCAKSGGAPDAELLQRYATLRDETAFEVLLWRHGPLVLSVCRRLLRKEEDIEDAFQATFLALASKPGSISKREAVGSWLYKVACRIALDVRRHSARWAVHEKSLAGMPVLFSQQDVPNEVARRELHSLLDAEIQRLPRKYRDPLVLCHLEGKTQEEAARELGWAKGTVSTRLIRARELLRRRLHQLGDIFPESALLPALASRALPPAIAKATLRAALSFQNSTTESQLISAKAIALAEGVLKVMALSQWKITAALLLVVASFGSGLGWLAYEAVHASAAAALAGQVSPPLQANDRHADGLLPSALGKLDPSRIPPEDRFPWQPSELVAVLGEHRGRSWGLLKSVACSPNGKLIASCGDDLFVRLWDATTLRELVALKQPSQAVCCVAFSPDGKILASGGSSRSGIDERTLVLWNLTMTPPRAQAVVEASEPFSTFAFSPDGSILACGGQKGIRLWKIAGHSEPEQLSLLPQVATRSLAFSGDGKNLACVGFDGDIEVWDIPTATQRMLLRSTILKNVLSVALSPDSKTLAAGGDSSNDRICPVVLWDLSHANNPREEAIRSKATFQVTMVKFSRDGKTLAAGNLNREVFLWYMTGTGPTLRARLENGSWCLPLDFSPDGKTLVLGYGGEMITLLDLTEPVPKDRFVHKGHTNRLQRIALAGRGLLASGAWDGSIRLWDLSGTQAVERFSFKLQQMPYRRIALSRDGKTLAFDRGDYSLEVWDLGKGKPRKRLQWSPLHPQGILAGFGFVGISPSGKILTTTGPDQRIRFWDLNSDPPRERKRIEGYATTDGIMNHDVGSSATVAYDPPKTDGVTSALWDRGPLLRIWDSSGSKPRREGPVPNYGLAFVPDSRDLLPGRSKPAPDAAIPPREEIWLWRRFTGEGPQRRTLRLESSGSADTGRWVNNGRNPRRQSHHFIYCEASSPDGQILASATDGKMILWELASGGKYREWQLPGPVYDLAFSEDGRHLITANGNGTIYVLRLGQGVGNVTPLAALWQTLATGTASKAYPAIWSLVATPRRTLAFFKEHLKAAEAMRGEAIAQLILRLNDDRFKVRAQASAALEQLREQAEPALRRRLGEQPLPLELRQRIERILDASKPIPPEQLRALRAIQVLEHIGNGHAQALLRRLAEGAPHARQTQQAQPACAILHAGKLGEPDRR